MGDIPHFSISNSAEGTDRRSLLVRWTSPEALRHKALEVKRTAKDVKPDRINRHQSVCC